MNVEELVKREYRRMALGTDRLCDCDFAHDNGENPILTDICQHYVTNFKEMKAAGMGLMLFGGTGAGKTYAVAEIVNALTDAGYHCMYTSLLKIYTRLSTLYGEGRQAYLDKICSQDLLALDEYGSEGESNNQTALYIINACYEKNIPLIVTSHYHKESLANTRNPQRLTALSRLWERCACVQVHVPQSRRYMVREQLDRTEKLLRGPGPYYEEPERFTEPCEEYRKPKQMKLIK